MKRSSKLSLWGQFCMKSYINNPSIISIRLYIFFHFLYFPGKDVTLNALTVETIELFSSTCTLIYVSCIFGS